ncbi:hypothetical protein BHM03_00038849 [Ensete ventricosum]|nr:hypothetical protein BHM03_00038849 [Ensete ventricosum]
MAPYRVVCTSSPADWYAIDFGRQQSIEGETYFAARYSSPVSPRDLLPAGEESPALSVAREQFFADAGRRNEAMSPFYFF